MEFVNRKRLYLATKLDNDELHYAAYYGDINTLELLLAYGLINNHRDHKGNTPLFAVLVGSGSKKVKLKMIDVLVNNGANINSTNNEGNSVLHVAVRTASFKRISRKIVRLLIDRGADKLLRNNAGKTAYELAFEERNSKLGTLLLFYERSSSKAENPKRGRYIPRLQKLFNQPGASKPLDEKKLQSELLKVQRSREFLRNVQENRKGRTSDLSRVVTADSIKEIKFASEVENEITDLRVGSRNIEERNDNERYRYLVECDSDNYEDDDGNKRKMYENKADVVKVDNHKSIEDNEGIMNDNEDNTKKSSASVEMLQHCSTMLAALENLFLMTILKDRYKELCEK